MCELIEIPYMYIFAAITTIEIDVRFTMMLSNCCKAAFIKKRLSRKRETAFVVMAVGESVCRHIWGPGVRECIAMVPQMN